MGMKFFKPAAIRKGVYIEERKYEGNKNLLKFVEEHYKCPQTELLSAPKKRKSGTNRDLARLRFRKDVERDEVPPGFFLTIIFSIQGSIHDIVKYLHLYCKFGAWLALLMFASIYIFIAMPLYMVFFFLSNYTRNSYVKIWLAVPILKGVSFSVAMLNFVSCILNMSLVTLNVVFIYATLANWLDCDYPYASNAECIRNFDLSVAMCERPNMEMPKLGMYVLLKRVANSTFGDSVNWYWIVVVLMTYALVILGELYSAVVLGPICRLTTIMWGIIFVAIILYEGCFGFKYTLISKTAGSFAVVLSPTYWVACAKTSLRRVMPGDLVTYGSITMPGMSPITMAVLMSLMRIVFTTTVANFYVISFNDFISYHNIRYPECIDVNGLSIIYCFIPLQLLKLDGSKLTLLMYFFLLTYMGFMSTFLSINGFVTAITGDYPNTKESKNMVIVIICTVMCIANVGVVGIGVEFLLLEDMKIYIAPLLTYGCVAFFISSYSPLRIANDFYFSFGQRLATYWNSLMKLYVIFVAVITMFYVMFQMYKMEKEGALYANVVAMILIITPIVVFATIRIYSAKKKKAGVIDPDPAWGSPNPVLRTARASFDAKRECRISMQLRCHHECLVESKLNMIMLVEMVTKFHLSKRKYLAQMHTQSVSDSESKESAARES